MGLAEDYLGIELIRDGSKSITLSQRAYFEKVLQKFKMDNANPRATPIQEGTRISMDSSDELLPLNEKLTYQSIVGSLTYGMQGTRPDLAFSISLLSRFLAKPTAIHMAIAKGVL